MSKPQKKPEATSQLGQASYDASRIPTLLKAHATTFLLAKNGARLGPQGAEGVGEPMVAFFDDYAAKTARSVAEEMTFNYLLGVVEADKEERGSAS